ncbi:hypothetical protein QBC36DRAFT_382520 [Triangularia setosa]|uniref:Peptidase A1 domain-containing protein n=1 Tax=Triangularia setosa TaxID=2587417 RepID=A0AAN6VZA8_9PEZI|nr:hypothetical protein QBC36DRAFT_382520 [Podospora setosa]
MLFRNLQAIQLLVALLALVQSAYCQQFTTSAKVEKLHLTGRQNNDYAHYIENIHGPWAMLSAFMGTYDSSNLTKDHIAVPLYPAPWANMSEIWWTGVLAWDKMPDAYNANRYGKYIPSPFGPMAQHGALLPDWEMSIPSDGEDSMEFLHVKNTVIALNYSKLYLEGEITTDFTNGDMLALAPPSEPGSRSILQQLKDVGRLFTASFGLYVGRPDWKLPSKMILGGYDKNRIDGDIMMFDLMDEPQSVRQGYLPRLYLSDVRLGSYDSNGYTFDWATHENPNRTIMYNIPERSWTSNLTLKQVPKPAVPGTKQFFKVDGRVPRALLVVPDPTVPHMYLPAGTCEHAAEDLPINWNDNYRLWIWDTSDPRYKRLMKAPAYMGFTLQNAFSPTSVKVKSLDIQVPLWLLDIGMDTRVHGRDTHLRYFPCRSVADSDGYWKLGRAFLQSAFLGVNYDDNIFYIAQTLGPGIEDKEELISFSPEFQAHVGNDRDVGWIWSWSDHWRHVERTSNGSGSIAPGSSGRSSKWGGLERGEQIGVVIGVVMGILAVCVLLGWFCISRLNQKKRARREAELELSNSAPVVAVALSQPTVPAAPRLPRLPTYKEEPDDAPPPYKP